MWAGVGSVSVLVLLWVRGRGRSQLCDRFGGRRVLWVQHSRCCPSVMAVLDAASRAFVATCPCPVAVTVLWLLLLLWMCACVPVGSVQPQLGQSLCAKARNIGGVPLPAIFREHSPCFGWCAGLLTCMCSVPYFGGSSLQQIPGPVPKRICRCSVHNAPQHNWSGMLWCTRWHAYPLAAPSEQLVWQDCTCPASIQGNNVMVYTLLQHMGRHLRHS